MRKRIEPYESAPGSIVIETPSRSLRLFPGHIVAAASPNGRLDLGAKLQSVWGDVEQIEGRSLNVVVASLFAFLLWDDPEIEWTSDFDADALLHTSSDDLLVAGLALANEVYSLATARLIAVNDLFIAVSHAISGKAEAPSTGEASPRES